MAVKKDNIISYRLTFVVVCVFAFSIAIAVKLFNIQWVGGEYYRNLAKQRTVKNFDIPANKGNIYSSDGSLLATSIPEYTIRFDAVAPSDENFEKNYVALSDSLARLLGKSSGEFQRDLRKAKNTKNRYFLVARKLSFTEYMRVKKFPLFK